jgi:hypothetical protein
MAIEIKSGSTVKVKISKSISRQTARKTLERLFLQDKAVAKPIEVRSANFKELPKRRGGCIWTKRPNKVHPALNKGDSATLKVTPQVAKDLASVASFIEIVK